jgi:hypothetical protein
MSNEAKEKALVKIKKCLALAKSSNPNEAQTALRQARKLMDMHKLEVSEVEASFVGEFSKMISARPPQWAWKLGQVCAEAFGCTVIGSKGWRGMEFRFIGADINPELSAYAFDVLLRQLKGARTAYVGTLNRCKLATKRRRGDEFANAWINSVYSLVADFSGADPVVAAQIESFKATKYPNLKTVPIKQRKQNSRDDDARYAGHRAGKSASLHKAMGADQRIALPNSGVN